MQNLDELFPTVAFDKAAHVTPVPWLIRDLWQKGKINVLFGPEKAGKSRFLNWMLVESMLSEYACGLRVEHKPQKMLYMAGEEMTNDVQGRMLRYAGYSGIAPRRADLPIDFIAAAGLRLDWEKTRHWVAEKLEREKYDVLVIDPLRRVHGADENDNTAMSKIFNDMRKWTNNIGVTLIMLHHTGKLTDEANYDRIATWGRGATDLAAILDTAQFVDRLTPSRLRILRAGRFKPVQPLELADGLDDEFVFRPTLKNA